MVDLPTRYVGMLTVFIAVAHMSIFLVWLQLGAPY